jgi:epoxyqueuosine reductase
VSDLASQLKQRAAELGFDACRITTAAPPESGPRLRQALADGRHAGMEWIARNADKRCNPDLVLPGARSIIALAVSYAHDPQPGPEAPASNAGEPRGIVARYARHSDYHDVLAPRLADLTAWLDAATTPAHRSLWYVDTGPILERDLAQRAGIGFVGRHTNIVSRDLGNWFLLAEILTQAELPIDPPARNLCGKCTRCLDACPTQALPAPFTLDARRCISYLTIELKGSIPEDLRPLIGNRIYGCDDCLAACPWNRFAVEARLLAPHRRHDLDAPALHDLLALDDATFRARFAGSPILRTKRRGFLRNVAVALGNIGGSESIAPLERATADPEPLIREHAAWALARIQDRLQRSQPPAASTSPPRHTAPPTPPAPPA